MTVNPLTVLRMPAGKVKVLWKGPQDMVKQDSKVSIEFIGRIAAAYRKSFSEFDGGNQTLWARYNARRIAIHDALMSDDVTEAHNMLSKPAKTHLFSGMDIIDPASIEVIKTQNVEKFGNQRILELLKLAEAVGVRRMHLPTNSGTSFTPELSVRINDLLDQISKEIGFNFRFPNPFSQEYGLPTARGIATFRGIQSLYQGWRIAELSKFYGPRVVEIGAGSGRTCIFAKSQGVKDYTIIDVPLTNVGQALFIGAVLGEDAVALNGEEQRASAVKILPPSSLGPLSFDLVANVDSLPEMSIDHSQGYVDFAAKNAKAFLSINHEALPFKVWNYAKPKAKLALRNPYWMRDGYSEELFVF